MVSKRMSQQEQKQKIDIIVSFKDDYEVTREEYEDYKKQLEQLNNKKRKTKDIKAQIENLETQINSIENNNSWCLYIDVKANVLMPCGHYEEFSSGIGGCWFNAFEGIEGFKGNYSAYINDDIDSVKDQVLNKLPNRELEFNVIYKEDY